MVVTIHHGNTTCQFIKPSYTDFMNIGIIVWSATGHTESVAQNMKETLEQQGHSVSFSKIAIDVDPLKRAVTYSIIEAPDSSPYDALILGAPVEAFCLSDVMKRYLTHQPALTGKKVFYFVTQYFPKPWMGGNNSVKQIQKLAESKGAISVGKAVINWSSSSRQTQIDKAVASVMSAFS